VKAFSLPYPSHKDVLPQHRPKCSGRDDHGTLKHVTQNNPFSLYNLIISSVCYSDTKLIHFTSFYLKPSLPYCWRWGWSRNECGLVEDEWVSSAKRLQKVGHVSTNLWSIPP
jgi:hypothetical protein